MRIVIYNQRLLPAIFLLCAGSALAQNWQKLSDRVDSLTGVANYPQAAIVARQALNGAEAAFGKDHPNYARSLGKLGHVELEKGDYAAAEVTLMASQDLYRKQNRSYDTCYVDVLKDTGILYRIQGRYPAAETILLEAARITEQLSGKENRAYAGILGSLSHVYAAIQDYKKAESMLLTVLDLTEKLLGKRHDAYANTLNSLGIVYQNLENYPRAESYMLEGLRIWARNLGPDHPNVGALLGNIGFLYLNQGAYPAAIQHLTKAVAIQEKKGPGSLNHIVALSNTALCYTRTRQYEKADSLYQKLLILTAQKLGTDHPQYATILNNLGFVAEARGQYPAALEQYQRALTTYSAKTGAETMGTAEMISNIASTCQSMNKLSLADSLYQKSLASMSRLVGTNSLRYAGTLDNYARLLVSNNQPDKAFANMTTAQTIISRSLTKNFLYQTARQKENLLAKWAPYLSTSFHMAWQNPQRSDVARLAYTGNLFLRNLLLSQHIGLFANGAQTADPRLRLLTDTLRQVSNQVASQYTLPVAQRQHLDSLEARAEKLEKELARQSAPFRQTQQALQVRWENIRDALKPTEATVEFVSFAHYNGRQPTDSVRYMALVLRPGNKAPQVVPLLKDEGPLRRLLAHKAALLSGASQYATRGSELDTDQLTKGDSLYQLIWQPIDRLLRGVKTVYFTPAGLLHQVSFAALPCPNPASPTKSACLADRYQLRQLSSTGQLAIPAADAAADTYSNIVDAKLYGGIQYDPIGAASQPTAVAAAVGWPFLPGTQREVEQISRIIGRKATHIMGTAATEVHLKTLSGQSPTVLHLATHGFAFPDPTIAVQDSATGQQGGSRFRQVANPLVRTGLLLAGANYVWQGGQLPTGQEDGVLTASEVASMNLSKTKLVVLSACETALGDIRGSEGVFGLQRAFKMAGAGSLLTSLWPVSDQTTSEFMAVFYQKWEHYKTRQAAFRQTQLQLRKTYPPSVWAAFVLID